MAPATQKGGPAPRLKIVVRRLPADLPPAVFWRTVAPWVTRESEQGDGNDKAERVAWTDYRQGKLRRSGKDKDSVPSRAYITFKTPDALVAFHRGYDGWSFRDKQGNISQAVVEFAPYQRTPAAPQKADPRQGTIDADADFLAFQEALAAAPEPVQPPTETTAAPKSTPLLDHLRAQKAASKAARKAATAANKAAAGKGKAKGPFVLPGATRAQLATAAAGGVQSVAAAAAAGGAKGKGKKGEGKKADKVKGGKGKKSKDVSRSATPVPGGSGTASTAPGANGAKPPALPKASKAATRPPSAAPPNLQQPQAQPGFPPGSFGAQQQAARAAFVQQAQQATLVRQQLQAAHRAASAPPVPVPSPVSAAAPQILRNPARQHAPSAQAPAFVPSATPFVPRLPPQMVPPSVPQAPTGGEAGRGGRGRGGGRGGARGGGGRGRGRGGRGAAAAPAPA